MFTFDYFAAKFRKSLSAEISSLSSYNSEDSESPFAPTPPTADEDTPDTPSKVKNIIDIFQQQKPMQKTTLTRQLSNALPDNGGVRNIAEKFENYIKKVPKYTLPQITPQEPLFYSCLLIERSQDVAQIKFKYPKDVQITPNIEQLCFPEDFVATNKHAQSYSMILTDLQGHRLFGYCRRVMPEGCTSCLPLAYCILSTHRSPQFYRKILEALESHHGLSDKTRDRLIELFYTQSYPLPGQSITVDLLSIYGHNNNNNGRPGFEDSLDLNAYVQVNNHRSFDDERNGAQEKVFFNDCHSVMVQTEDKIELELTLHSNEVADLGTLHKLPVNIILRVFASMLLERKVVIFSTKLSELSSTIDALQSILSPFVWQHTLIPVLPTQLWPVVESPTPVMCGCLSQDVLQEHIIDYGIVVDLENGRIIQCEGDEDKILATSMKKEWKRAFSQSTKSRQHCLSQHSTSIAYRKTFALCMQNYRNFIVQQADGTCTFSTSAFVESAKSRGIKKFLQLFTQTFMFNEFIRTAVRNPDKDFFV